MDGIDKSSEIVCTRSWSERYLYEPFLNKRRLGKHFLRTEDETRTRESLRCPIMDNDGVIEAFSIRRK